MSDGFILGIDPGFEGAIAFMSADCGYISVINTPLLPRKAKGRPEYDLVAMRGIAHPYVSSPHWRDTIVVIEEPIPMPKQSCVSTARQFTGYGIWLGLVSGVTLYRVKPSVWKKAMGLSAEKAKSIAMAHDLFPTVPLVGTRLAVEGKAEALLLAEYGRRFL